MYTSGSSPYAIAKELNTNPPRIRRALKKLRIHLRTLSEAMSSLPAKEIITECSIGVSARRLAIKHNTTITSITDLLKRNNIELRPPATTSNWEFIYKLDDLFLYWLGWALTDGCIFYRIGDGRRRGVTVDISVQRRDKHILEFFKQLINPNQKIYYRKNQGRLRNSIKRASAVFLTHQWGFAQRKSLTLKPTSKLRRLSKRQFWQLFVGLIEGDGSVDKNGCISCVSGSLIWLQWVRKMVGFGIIKPHNGSWRLRLKMEESLALFRKHLSKVKFKLLSRKWDRIRLLFPPKIEDFARA